MTMRPSVQIQIARFCGFFIISLAVVDSASGQIEDGLSIRRSRDTGLATFVTSADGGPILVSDAGGVASVPLSADQFLERYGRLFGVSDRAAQLAADGVERDQLGHMHVRFKQEFSGIPVFGGQLRVHQDAVGRVLAANGDFFPVPAKLDVRPALTADAAVARAAGEFESEKPLVHRAELIIVDPGWYGDAPIGARLAYHVELEDPVSWNATAFFIDAHLGKILDQWSLIEHFRVRKIHDGNQQTDLPGLIARAEGQAAVSSLPDVNRAYDYYGDTYGYYWRAFGRDSMDNLGMPMVATVNSIAPGCPNAFWSSARLQMAFCIGTVTDDITAHELTHGVTYFTAGLIYQNQSGQLNESYSDVFGELVDLFNGNAAFALVDNGTLWPSHPTGPGLDQLNSLRTECSPRTDYFDGVRWLMGEDAYAFGGAIRDMWDPTCAFDPDRALSPLQTCGPGDNGGVHSGSGIPNHAFAMLVDGKNFNGYSVRGIGPIKAGAVWYRALTTYLNPTSDFEDAYAAMTQAAQDLMGTYPLDPRTGFPSSALFSADDAEQVDFALRAVEMNGPGRCGWTVPLLSTERPPICGDELLIYFDDFESGAPGWTVRNSAPLTPYDWRLAEGPLPYGRPGTVWMCDDPDLGDCDEKDESGSHSLISPPIELPPPIQYPLLRFTHHINTETAWDGGQVRLRVNGRSWFSLPGSSFHFNPYNTKLRSASAGNSNPLAGREAWSGIGSQWGTSVVDLSEFARGGDTIEIRFDFGKDGCTGRVGWFVDDVEVSGCTDCNFNGQSDDLDLFFRNTSGALSEIGAGSPQRYVLDSPPRAAGDVLLRFYTIADLAGELQDESLFVSLNGVLVGEIFGSGASDCPSSPDTAELVIPREQFNLAALAGAVTIDITATASVNPRLCGNSSWVRVDFEYLTLSADEDGDHVPDECQSCQVPTNPSGVLAIVPMNRYLAFVPTSGARHVAYRIRRTSQIDTANSLTPSVMWVGPPVPAAYSDDPPVSYAHPQCSPYFSSEWNDAGPIFVFGDFIVPGAGYLVDAIEVGCWSTVSVEPLRSVQRIIPATRFSKALAVTTASLWGDVAGSQAGGGPDGKVDMVDVTAVVDRFRGISGAVTLQRADLSPAIPDHKVDFSDIAEALNAYRGEHYPYSVAAPACVHRTQ